ncbi:MAG TPA: DNA polymerase IV [Candidatus Merdenecus merdavium]|nr:DNA polymerase IV [Candidatus Merdenecus merdavium]
MEPIIFHIDVNSAFLSWTSIELLKNGETIDLRTIPSVIGHDDKNHRGVVLAKSIPAKAYHIKTGEPMTSAFRKCPNLVVRNPDHKMYQEYSKKLMDYLYELTPDLEQLSIDECFLDFTGISHLYPSYMEGAKTIQKGIYDQLGFTVNIGISNNKLLAKMASDFEKPYKIHTLFPSEVEKKMWPLPVSDLYMAGRASVETLKNLEIFTIGDLAQADPKILELHLKSHGRTLWKYANGIASSTVNSHPLELKGIGNSTTVPKDITTFEEAKPVLRSLAETVSQRLRKADQLAGNICVEIKYSTFTTASHQIQLKIPTNTNDNIYQIACHLFLKLWDKTPVRLLGIRSNKLISMDEPVQLSLFDMELKKDKKQENLDHALDHIRGKFGHDSIIRGSLFHK